MNKYGLENKDFGVIGVGTGDWKIGDGIRLGFYEMPPVNIETLVWGRNYSGAYNFRSICEMDSLFCAKQLDPKGLGKKEVLEEAFRVDKAEEEVGEGVDGEQSSPVQETGGFRDSIEDAIKD